MQTTDTNNSAASGTKTVGMTVYAPPQVAFTSESENEASESWTLTLNVSDTGGSGVQSVKVYLGSISTANYLGAAALINGTWKLTTPPNVPDSSQLTFVAVVTDNSGNTATAKVTVADPAGVAGNPINLALTDPSGGQATGPITLTLPEFRQIGVQRGHQPRQRHMDGTDERSQRADGPDGRSLLRGNGARRD